MYRLRRRVFRQAVHQFLPPRADLEILDIGSGTGFYLDRWQELGFPNVHASDVSEVAVERLRERYPSCEVTQLDIAGLREPCQPGEAGPAVVFSENFVHQRNPREAQQVNRSLA
jgi:SAM-dependent methyltransferase